MNPTTTETIIAKFINPTSKHKYLMHLLNA